MTAVLAAALPHKFGEFVMKGFHLEESSSVGERFALVYAPRRQRKRFPENCVQVVESEEAALTGANQEKDLFPARVAGPSRSSEGFRLYYLVRWLDIQAED